MNDSSVDKEQLTRIISAVGDPITVTQISKEKKGELVLADIKAKRELKEALRALDEMNGTQYKPSIDVIELPKLVDLEKPL